jgi:hypothetical protein
MAGIAGSACVSVHTELMLLLCRFCGMGLSTPCGEMYEPTAAAAAAAATQGGRQNAALHVGCLCL